MRAFGYNNSFGIGDGSTEQRLAPVLVTGVADAIAVAAGVDHSLALRANGTVVAWGNNQFGKLGDGTTTTRLTPMAVSGLSNVVAIAAGQAHSLALDGDGHVWAWGSGFYGALGIGGTGNALTPVQILTLEDVTAIAAGYQHSVALVDGVVRTWGLNTSGQIGSGTDLGTYLQPFAVEGLTPITAIAAGANQTFAFAADGGIYAWGGNASGVLGDGTTDKRLSPTVIAEAGGMWRVGQPRFSVLPGTFSTHQSVLITSATAGATVRYTIDGSDPIETSVEVPPAGVLVNGSRTLRTRAWKAGHAPSPIATATYTLRPATPVVTPGSSTAATPQSITFSTVTSGAEVHHTLDGTEPTLVSPVYERTLLRRAGSKRSALSR